MTQKQWLRYKKGYESFAAKELINHFRQQVNTIPFFAINKDNIKEVLNGSIRENDLYTTYYNFYLNVGLSHGQRIGKKFNDDLKNFSLDLFSSELQKGLFRWILQNVGERIVSVNSTFKVYIQNIIQQGFNDGKTIEQITTDIQKLIAKRSFYRWQALRIARTETTTAANRATNEVGRTSNALYKKVWVSGQDNRTRTLEDGRFDHKAMHLKEVAKDEYFNVNGEEILYPAAPETKQGNRTSAANVIQCRCTFSLVPMRDSNGRVIRR